MEPSTATASPLRIEAADPREGRGRQGGARPREATREALSGGIGGHHRKKQLRIAICKQSPTIQTKSSSHPNFHAHAAAAANPNQTRPSRVRAGTIYFFIEPNKILAHENLMYACQPTVRLLYFCRCFFPVDKKFQSTLVKVLFASIKRKIHCCNQSILVLPPSQILLCI
jgi:hypothetical protein